VLKKSLNIMKTLEIVYWLRFGFGILAALVGLGVGLATGAISKTQLNNSTTFFNSASLAIIVYVISYYVIKSKFVLRVQKPQKLLTTGIGIYFLAWLVFWALFYTLFIGQLS
jgi:hypothetical protein